MTLKSFCFAGYAARARFQRQWGYLRARLRAGLYNYPVFAFDCSAPSDSDRRTEALAEMRTSTRAPRATPGRFSIMQSRRQPLAAPWRAAATTIGAGVRRGQRTRLHPYSIHLGRNGHTLRSTEGSDVPPRLENLLAGAMGISSNLFSPVPFERFSIAPNGEVQVSAAVIGCRPA